MLRLAVAGRSGLEVSTIEIDRDSDQFTFRLHHCACAGFRHPEQPRHEWSAKRERAIRAGEQQLMPEWLTAEPAHRGRVPTA